MPPAGSQATTRDVLLDSAQRIMSRNGFSAVGLNEILRNAEVPKGSFYHYFESKDAFGVALLDRYFDDYLADMDELFAADDRSARERVIAYLQGWQETQRLDDCQGKCLAVKLGAEVADFSEAMRLALKRGVEAIVDRLADMVERGQEDRSIRTERDARITAAVIYDLWLGASVVAKINRDAAPLDAAMAASTHLLDT